MLDKAVFVISEKDSYVQIFGGKGKDITGKYDLTFKPNAAVAKLGPDYPAETYVTKEYLGPYTDSNYKEGGKITLTFDDKKGVASGHGSIFRFYSNTLNKDAFYRVTGKEDQPILVYIRDTNLTFDVNSGVINAGSTSMYVMGGPDQGGTGNWLVNHIRESSSNSINDSNTQPGYNIDLSDGLGCTAWVEFEIGVPDNERNYDNFVFHFKGDIVSEEYDGKFFDYSKTPKKRKPRLRRTPVTLSKLTLSPIG